MMESMGNIKMWMAVFAFSCEFRYGMIILYMPRSVIFFLSTANETLTPITISLIRLQTFT